MKRKPLFMLRLITFLVAIATVLSEKYPGIPCYTKDGEPTLCMDGFDNSASVGKKISATNTCGVTESQKYCIHMSSRDQMKRCAYCDEKDSFKGHPASHLTDENTLNWWQSETVAANKDLTKKSVNLTLDLGNIYLVNYIHFTFKSPRPVAMIIYRKFDDDSDWTVWGYFSNNCQAHFNMESVESMKKHQLKGGIPVPGARHPLEDLVVRCKESYENENAYYNGHMLFSTFYMGGKYPNFFDNDKLLKWITASQIRIELKTMFRQSRRNEKETQLTQFWAMSNFQVNARCWCHGHGNDCRKSSGQNSDSKIYCICSHNTEGQSCQKCKKFYNDRLWKAANTKDANICKRCECNGYSDDCYFDYGTYVKSNYKSGGICTNCRGNTEGVHCEVCRPGYYKVQLKKPQIISMLDGVLHNKTWECDHCNCNSIGSFHEKCNSNGECVCKPGVTGKKCTRCLPDQYAFGEQGCMPCNCNSAGIGLKNNMKCNPQSGICNCKQNVNGESCDKCLDGYFSLNSKDPLGCQPCFCYAHTRQCEGAKNYYITTIESSFKRTTDGWYYLRNKIVKTPYLDTSMKERAITWFYTRDRFSSNYFLYAPKKFLGDQRNSYNLLLKLYLSFRGEPKKKYSSNQMRTMTPDIELVGQMLSVSVPFDVTANNPKPMKNNNKPILYQYILNEESGGWRERLDHYRFISLLSNLTALRIRITNLDGYVMVHKVILEKAVTRAEQKKFITYTPALTKENCTCPEAYTGLSCENCADGYYRETPYGSPFVKCIKCDCNNQGDTCDKSTGKCNCNYNTTGKNCEMCKVGFYGDPTTKKNDACKPCGCPKGTSCLQIKNKQIYCTNCPDMLSGPKCTRCPQGYFGDPLKGVSCKKCNCHGNIGHFSTCDQKTGKCPICLYNSMGDYCELCKPGYFIKPHETSIRRCVKCNCSPFGTANKSNLCNNITGNCDCKPMYSGQNCDRCKDNHYNNSLTKDCESCNCSPLGSYNSSCNYETGQCACRPGLSGRKCGDCKPNYYDFKVDIGCRPCNCHPKGSKKLACNMNSGKCDCHANVIGLKCDQCKENYFNLNARCQKCPGCYALVQERLNKLGEKFVKIIKYNLNSSLDTFDTPEVKELVKKLQTIYELMVTKTANTLNMKEDAKILIEELKKIAIDPSNINLIEVLNNKTNDIKRIESEIFGLISQVNKYIEELGKRIKDEKLSNNYGDSIEDTRDRYNKYMKNFYEPYKSFMDNYKSLLANSSTVELIKNRDMLIKTYAMAKKQKWPTYFPEAAELLNDADKIKKKFTDWDNDFESEIKKKDEIIEQINDLKFNGLQPDELNKMKTNTDLFKADFKKLNDTLSDIKTDVKKYSDQFSGVKLKVLYDSLLKSRDNVNKVYKEAEDNIKKLKNGYKDFENILSPSKTIAQKYLNKMDDYKNNYDQIKQKLDCNEKLNDKLKKLDNQYMNLHENAKTEMGKWLSLTKKIEITETESQGTHTKLENHLSKLKEFKKKFEDDNVTISQNNELSKEIRKKIDAATKRFQELEYVIRKREMSSGRNIAEEQQLKKQKKAYAEINYIRPTKRSIKNILDGYKEYKSFQTLYNRKIQLLLKIKKQLVYLTCWRTGALIEG